MKSSYTTDDVYLAAYLVLQGVAITLALNGSRVLFQAEPTNNVNQLILDFGSDKPVGVTGYVEAVKTLRSQMYAKKNTGQGVCLNDLC